MTLQSTLMRSTRNMATPQQLFLHNEDNIHWRRGKQEPKVFSALLLIFIAMLTDHLFLALWQRKGRYLWICRNHYKVVGSTKGHSYLLRPGRLQPCWTLTLRHILWWTHLSDGLCFSPPWMNHKSPWAPSEAETSSASTPSLPICTPLPPSVFPLTAVASFFSTHHLPCVCSLFNPPPHPQCGPSLFFSLS